MDVKFDNNDHAPISPHIHTVTVDVSLILNGVKAQNNSLVDVDDVLYTTRYNLIKPTNCWPIQHDSALLCVTDLVDCCEREELGNWYLPDGSMVLSTVGRYRSNRGQNEVIGGRQFYGSVRLYRYYSPRIRGHFRCELPDADNVTQTLYANIGKISNQPYAY